MLGKIPDGLQSLHFNTLTISPTKVIKSKGGQGASNFVQRSHDVGIIHKGWKDITKGPNDGLRTF
jgi:hypothetical protein